MKEVDQSFEILTDISDGGLEELKHIEKIARVCYKSEDLIKEGSAEKMVKGLIGRHHDAMLEHGSISVLITTDRGVSHELVRHRLASYAQESTRYCNYAKDKFGNELTFIRPWFYSQFQEDEEKKAERITEYLVWSRTMKHIEDAYFELVKNGSTGQEARSVLPNSIKTNITMTANYREWRHFLKLRAEEVTGPVHPQMHELAVMILREFKKRIPVIFDDIQEGNINNLPNNMK